MRKFVRQDKDGQFDVLAGVPHGNSGVAGAGVGQACEGCARQS